MIRQRLDRTRKGLRGLVVLKNHPSRLGLALDLRCPKVVGKRGTDSLLVARCHQQLVHNLRFLGLAVVHETQQCRHFGLKRLDFAFRRGAGRAGLCLLALRRVACIVSFEHRRFRRRGFPMGGVPRGHGCRA